MFILNLDLNGIRLETDRLKLKADVLLEHAAADLAAQTYNHIIEEAQRGLHTTREQYINALSYSPSQGGGWVVTLDKSALWIEDGMPRHEMIDDLVKNGRVSKKTGARYKVIPFAIKGPSNTAPAAMATRQAAMRAIKRAGINMREIEHEVDGRIKMGALHKLNVMGSPLKTANGVYQGHGPIGQVRQGMTGTPFLQGLQVRQVMISKLAGGQIQKQALTFRVVSTLHKGSGRWVHPGIKAHNFMDKAFAWAEQEWESNVKPQILEALANAH